MTKPEKKKKLYYWRSGMERSGPLTRRRLIRYLSAGLIDAQTLVSVDDDGCMMPLGASEASAMLTTAVKHWRWQFSPVIYFMWLLFIPLYTAAVMSFIILYSNGNYPFFTVGIFLSNLGLGWWLCRMWRTLLADRSVWWTVMYGGLMTIPGFNALWIWVGYLSLPAHWKKFQQRHNLPEKNISYLYYAVMIIFYMMLITDSMVFLQGGSESIHWLYITTIVSWLWFGMTILSLFLTEEIAVQMVGQKLDNLAYGALRFFADIDYDIFYHTTTVLNLRKQRKFRIAGLVIMVISWLGGSLMLINALNSWMISQH